MWSSAGTSCKNIRRTAPEHFEGSILSSLSAPITPDDRHHDIPTPGLFRVGAGKREILEDLLAKLRGLG
jgi:hypothetical protein